LPILVRTLRLKIVSASIWHPVNLTTVVLVPATNGRCIVWLGRRKSRNRSILVWIGRGLRDRNWNVLVWRRRVSCSWNATHLSLSLLKLPLRLCCFGSKSSVLEFCTKDFFIGYETSEHITQQGFGKEGSLTSVLLLQLSTVCFTHLSQLFFRLSVKSASSCCSKVR
jgi:hypothetical protein